LSHVDHPDKRRELLAYDTRIVRTVEQETGVEDWLVSFGGSVWRLSGEGRGSAESAGSESEEAAAGPECSQVCNDVWAQSVDN